MTQEKNRNYISIEMLRTLISCDGETGELLWQHRPACLFKPDGRVSANGAAAMWNGKWAGKPALSSVNSSGYKCGRIFSRAYKAHQVVVALTQGEWPLGDVDHIDGDKANNRPSNLRLATRAENVRNVGKLSNNTSGFKNVSFDKTKNLWRAGVTVNGKRVYLGRFKKKEDAYNAFCERAEKLHGEFFNRG